MSRFSLWKKEDTLPEKRVKVFNALAAVSSMYYLFHPYPYMEGLVALAVMPWFGLMLSKGAGKSLADLTKLTTGRNGKSGADLPSFLIFPPVILLIRALLDVSPEYPVQILLPGLALLSALWAFIRFTHGSMPPDVSKRRERYVTLVFVLLAYS